MSGGGISTIKIALNNILQRRFRSVCIVLLIAVTTLLITGGTLLGYSLRNGIESVNARLGADAMIVPSSAGDSFEGALLKGSPSTFYLSADVAERIAQTDGVERATQQLFITTFDSEHCAALVQIIGYNPETDFVVAPWLMGSKVTEPKYGEIVVGSNIQLKAGQQMQLFALNLDVAGVLDKTGMGFDNSVFVNMDTAKLLLAEYEKFAGALPLPEGTDVSGAVSAVLIDIEDDADPVAFQRDINFGFRGDGVRYVSSQALLSNTTKNLNLVIGVLTVLLAAIWMFAVFVLAIIFTLALNERQREFGILRAIGATRRKLTAIVLTETVLLCSVGAIFGVGAVCLIVFPYSALIERVLQTAYLPPQSVLAAAILIACLILGAAIGPLASLFSAARIGKSDAFANMREGL
ncbi:MAG: FtsX-like permease family protein [Oscillospiraceae bacterium]|jgi:putative ABC transport system permease protein|nr:FtsX-like permease family protein [Oscillospiraceae bacterium]